MKTIFTLFLALLISSFSFAQGSGHQLSFNGSSSYVSCGTISLSGNAITMMGWFNANQFNSLPSPGANISSLWGSEVGTPTLMRLGDGGALAKEKIQFVVNINGNPIKLNGTTTLVTGKWYHVAGVYDGSSLKIYIDGVLEASMSQSGTITSNMAFNIGQNYHIDRTFNGQIDEVSVFKSALSQSTIREWMCQKIKPSHPNYSTLEGYWSMDNGSGNTVTDLSGKGHTGSLVSSPTWQLSEIPLGDTCVSDYTNPFFLSLNHPDGDSAVVDSITGATAAYLYRIDGRVNNQNFQGGSTIYDSSRYWGVYYISGGTARGDFEYFFSKNSHYKTYGGCLTNLFNRDNNARASWTNSLGSLNGGAIKKRNQTRKEYVISYTGSSRIYSKDSARICENDSIMLRHTTTGYTYNWYKNGSIISGNTSNTFYAKDSGDYHLITQFGNCNDTSNSVMLRTNPIPNVTFGALNPVCGSEQFYTLTPGTPTGGKFINPYISGNLFVVKTAGPGLHKIVYEYTDNIGCSDTASQILTVLSLPTVKINNLSSVCIDSADFTLTGGTPAGGDYYINGTKNSTFSASSLGVGSHYVKYKYTDNNNCWNQDSVQVVINDLPTLQLVLSKKTFCEYDGIYTPNGHSPRGGVFSGTGISGGQFNPKTAGVGTHLLTYTYTESTTGCTNSITENMVVNAKPAKPVITANGVELSAGTADTYQWHDKNGKILGETNQIYKALFNGAYSVQVTTKGCVSDMSDPFNVDYVGISEDTESLDLKIYPNPFKNEITVDINQSFDKVEFEIISLEGKLVLNGKVSPAQNTIDTSELQAGSYVLKISGNDKTFIKGLMKY